MSTKRWMRLTTLAALSLALIGTGCKGDAEKTPAAEAAEAAPEATEAATAATAEKPTSQSDLAYTVEEAKAFEADAAKEITADNASEKATALLAEIEGQLQAEGLEMPKPRKMPPRKKAPAGDR